MKKCWLYHVRLLTLLKVRNQMVVGVQNDCRYIGCLSFWLSPWAGAMAPCPCPEQGSTSYHSQLTLGGLKSNIQRAVTAQCVLLSWHGKVEGKTRLNHRPSVLGKLFFFIFSHGNLHRPNWFHKHLPLVQYMSRNMLKQRKRFQKLWLQALHGKTCAYEMLLNCILLLRNYEKLWFALFNVSL